MSTTMVASEVKAVPPVVSSIQDIPLEKICESKTNPRTQFDQTKLAELADFVSRNKMHYVPNRIMWPYICLAERMKAVKHGRQLHCGAEALFDQVNRSPPTTASDSTLESPGSKRTS